MTNLVYQTLIPSATYSPWAIDIEFNKYYQSVRNNTYIDIYRCYELWTLAKQLKEVPGCFLQVGVWKGGSGVLLACADTDRNVYLADTFKGLVKVGDIDINYQGGEHAVSSKHVLKLIEMYQLDNITVLKGIFPDETGNDILDRSIALLHIDVDVYQSAKDIVEWALPRLRSGSIIIFPHYGFNKCVGITKYVNEIKDDFLYIYNLNGNGILIKR